MDLRQKGAEEPAQTPDKPDAAPLLATMVSGPVPSEEVEIPATPVKATVVSSGVFPDLEPIEPLVEPEPIVAKEASVSSEIEEEEEEEPEPEPSIPATVAPTPELSKKEEEEEKEKEEEKEEEKEKEKEKEVESSATPISATPGPSPQALGSTQLQEQSIVLLHIRTNTQIELPANLSVVHIGKPNDRVPPDIDVSGFPDAEVVSRTHADIRVEGDSYYLEDVGSSNGTYVNNNPLTKGNRHRLRQGDRISLGKGDLVSFLFKVSSLN
jgi:pSer/pThr/pTyr-binding forkhead associated (FHA) protein